MDASGFDIVAFVDLYFEKNEQDYYTIRPTEKGKEFVVEEPDNTYYYALGELSELTEETRQYLFHHQELAQEAGYGPEHPFGRTLSYATLVADELKAVLTDKSYEWNDLEIRRLSAAKVGLYLWKLRGGTSGSLKEIDNLLSLQEYGVLVASLQIEMARVLPELFPEYQNVE